MPPKIIEDTQDVNFDGMLANVSGRPPPFLLESPTSLSHFREKFRTKGTVGPLAGEGRGK